MLETWKNLNLVNESQFSEIQGKVDKIVIPRNVGRIPGKILHGFSKFTADEWKFWTIVFCLHRKLPSAHLECWRLFVRACILYASKVITRDTIEQAHRLILSFCQTAVTIWEGILLSKDASPLPSTRMLQRLWTRTFVLALYI